MRISNSKKQLAKIISENGGWRDGVEFSVSTCDGVVIGSGSKPRYTTKYGWVANGGFFEDRIKLRSYLKNWHQTIVSRDEYFHLYPAPDAGVKVEVENRTSCHLTVADSPAIEQLAADYHVKMATAQQAQEEADSHRCGAEAALERLVAAGKALGLVLSVATPESELMITDWRDLQVGDLVWVDAYDNHPEGEWPVNQMEDASYTCDYAFAVKTGVSCERWVDVTEPWKFIRRPSKEADNA